jgi:hypothetical protein
VYRWAGADSRAAALRPHLPRLIHHDARRDLLVLELARPESEAERPTVDFLPELARILATCHHIAASQRPRQLDGLPETAPWVFDLTRPSPGSLRELAPAQLALLQAVQSEGRLEAVLAAMRNEWTSRCLIHSDLKGANLVGTSHGVLLLDWELAQWGDPAWDLGGVFHAVIAEAVLALELPDRSSAGQAMEMLGATISGLRHHHASFWEGYRAERDGEPDPGLRGRLPLHTGLRLVKTAYEWCQSETRMPRRAAALLQLGVNLMLQPEQADRTVLGFP